MADFYTDKTHGEKFEIIIPIVKDFMRIVNAVFDDSKRNIFKKPSFLEEASSYSHETDLLAVKKLKLIDHNPPS